MGKRVFDLLVSGVALLLLSPLLAAIALAIKFDSPGPVFFRQERIGRGGVPFRIHKFRTMVHAPQAEGPLLTVGQDARITRVGSWLRRSKLDELAQLIDVLQGTMSLVGPRPEVPRYVALYPSELRDKVLSVRPGITDPVSIAFRDESEQLARAADPEREYVERIMPLKLQQAARYAEHATLASDLGVLWQTARLIVARTGKAAP